MKVFGYRRIEGGKRRLCKGRRQFYCGGSVGVVVEKGKLAKECSGWAVAKRDIRASLEAIPAVPPERDRVLPGGAIHAHTTRAAAVGRGSSKELYA